MKENILIVEDEFVVANDLKLMLLKSGYGVCGIATTVTAAQRMIEKYRPTWVLLDIFLRDESMGTDLAQQLVRENIGFIYISANTNQTILEKAKATQPYGFLVKPFRENDLLVMLDIARDKHRENLDMIAQREIILEKQLQHISESPGSAEEKLSKLPKAFQGLIPFDFISVDMTGRKGNLLNRYGFIRDNFDEYTILQEEALYEKFEIGSDEIDRYISSPPTQQSAVFFNSMDYRRLLLDDAWERRISSYLDLHSKICYSYNTATPGSVTISFHSQKDECYNVSHLSLLRRIESLVLSIFTAATPAVKETLSRIRPKVPQAEKFEGMVGNSPQLLKVLDNIDLVAPTPVSVLILGESGTGKECIARAIHKRSPRRNNPMIVVNCAALPPDLIESELFGHEKGAFTGALERRVGKFEVADGGTIFLDEVGELSADAQVKLLRVLQEREFERVGSNTTIKVDVRIIAATNRNMEKEIADGQFRLDLFYRLNVFPINVPPLRDRKGDIPLLAQHFITKFADMLGKDIKGVSANALKQLSSYAWPGNIRELEHLIQRSVLVTKGTMIDEIEMSSLSGMILRTAQEIHSNGDQQFKTLRQNEMDHIIEVLKKCGGRVTGQGGAAEILGLPASTLNSKLKKFGIRREYDF